METGPWGLCKEVVVNFVVLHCCGEGSDIYIYDCVGWRGSISHANN